MAILYIIRGLPGAGKSTLARRLVDESRHREADMYHEVEGEYRYVVERAKYAHIWCLKEVEILLKDKSSDCAVSNTFTQRKEYQPYIDAAYMAGCEVQVIDCHGRWKNLHNVPTETLLKMAARWQPHDWSTPCQK